ncbi:MAG: PQQ-like beta-propeller repeat protein, partial [Bacteroidota bacterium]|nr:PQQ-like beta-propeller repeat protein [Bacteroidota bacterium]
MSFPSCKKGRELSTLAVDDAILWKWERAHNLGDVFLSNEKVILFLDEPHQVVALSKFSGKVLWQSEELEFPEHSSAPLDWVYSVAVSGNILIASTGITTYAIELDKGKVLWSATLTSGLEGSMCIIDDFVYVANAPRQKSQLWRYAIQTGQAELLFELTIQEHGNGTNQPVLCNPVKWVNQQGEELLIMANSGFHPSDRDSCIMDLIAWNLTTKSFAWYKKGFSEQNAGRAIIEDNRVYFRGTRQTRCLDAETGNILWSYFHSSHHFGFNIPMLWVVKDKLVVRGAEDALFALDKMTGKQLWMNNEAKGESIAIMRVCQDILWSNWSTLSAFDIHTGVKLFNWGYSSRPFWNHSTLCDPASGYIFTG